MSDQNFKVKHGIAITGSSQDTIITSDNNGNLLVGGNAISLPAIFPDSANTVIINPNTISLSSTIGAITLDNTTLSFWGIDGNVPYTSSDLNIINAAMPAGNCIFDGHTFTITTSAYIVTGYEYIIRFDITNQDINSYSYYASNGDLPIIYKNVSNQGLYLTNDGSIAYWGSIKGAPSGSTPNDGSNNTAVGLGALITSLGTANSQNTAVGFNALNAVNDTRNTAIGEHAASQMQSGRNNVFVGDGSAENLTTGYGENLVIIGHNTAQSLTTSNVTNVTLVGAFANNDGEGSGYDNIVAIGDHTTGGNNSVTIGSQSSASANSISIGYQALSDQDNQIKLGNIDTARFTIPGLGIDWSSGNIPSIGTIPVAGTDYIAFSEKGTSGGVATLDGSGQVPLSELGNALPTISAAATTLQTSTAFSQVPYGGITLNTSFNLFTLAPYGSFTSGDAAIFNAAFPVGSVVTATSSTASGTFTVASVATINGGGYIVVPITTSEPSTIYFGFSGAATLSAGGSTAGKYLTNDGTTSSWGTVAGYSAPTLGSTSIASGSTVTNLDGVTINSTTIPSSKTLVTTSDTIAITQGGTGQITAAAAANALLPSQTSNSGKYLTTNGTGTLSWGSVSGYSAPTIGSTSIASGSTVTNLDGVTINSTTIPSSKTLVTTSDTGSVTNTMLAGSIADSKLNQITTASKVANSATTATDANTASAIVARDASGNFIANLITVNQTPTASAHAASKAYVDSVAAGMNWHSAVKAATTATIGSTYSNGTLGVGATLASSSNGVLGIDGVTLAIGNRILVKDQTDAKQNGIYVVTTLGSGSATWLITRASDADNSTPGQVAPGDAVYVQSGTVNNNQAFIETSEGTGTNLSIVLGTDSITWTQFTGAANITAGNGLTRTGNSLDVVSSTLTVSADSVDLSTVSRSNTTGSATNSLVSSITTDTYGRVTAVATSPINVAGTGLPFTGSTSGTITVAATAIAGTNTLTLPASSGTVSTEDAAFYYAMIL